MGVRTLHIDEMSESVGFPLTGGHFSVEAASLAVTSLDFCIVGSVGLTGFKYVVLFIFRKL